MLFHGGYINDKSSLDLIMAWHQIGAKPSSEPVMTQFKDVCMQHKEMNYLTCCGLVTQYDHINLGQHLLR